MSRQLSEVIETFEGKSWQEPFASKKNSAADALEDGKVLFFPKLSFELLEGERRFLSPGAVDPKAKNVSFNPKTGEVKHAVGDAVTQAAVAEMMRRYYEHAYSLVCKVVPNYESAIEAGRTSFRPVEVSGRKSSSRKDDTRLHVD